MDNSDETIEMPALGRPFELGMLYDCRREILIPGITLWDQKTLQSDIKAKRQCKTEFDIITSDSVQDKTSSLKLNASLKVSLLGGLVEVGGSGTYLEDTKKSMNHARLTLQYSTTTEFKHLTMTHLGKENISYQEVFEQGTATHVVTAMLYGAQAFFVFDCEVSESEHVRDIQGQLQAMVKKMPKVSAEAGGSLKWNDAEKEIDKKLNCTFHGDFSLENNPTTYQDAMKIYTALPKMLGEYGEKAVPVRVWLYPLTKLDSNAARLVRDISSQLVFDMEDTLEKLTEMDIRCNDLIKNPIASTFSEISDKIQILRGLCKRHRQVFQEQLSATLPSIRGGGQEVGALVDILRCLDRSPFNTQTLTEFLKKKEREANMVKSYISAVKDLEIVSSQTRLDDILLKNTNDLVVSFTFTSLHNKEPYLSDLHQWLQKKYSEGNPDPTTSPTSSSSKEQSKPWFEDEERKQRIRQAAKSISEFAKNNKENGNVRFIVSSVHDCENPGASIYLYEQGSLISTSYELPSKPLPPLVGDINRNSVQLTFQPAAYGKAAISNYQVEYKIAGEENWVKVNSKGNLEKYTVEELHPNTEYTFRYAARCKPGLSQRSEQIYVKTLLPSPSCVLKKFGHAEEERRNWGHRKDGMTSGAPAMDNSDETIEMPALGRPFELGMLYDCRRETLIPGIRLWDPKALEKDVHKEKHCTTEFRILTSDSVRGKTSSLDLNPSLKASFLGGLVEVGGSATYLNDTKKSMGHARVTLQYLTTAEFRQWTMWSLGKEKVPYQEALEHISATHVVAAVLYGAQAFFVFDCKLSESEKVEDVEGHLQQMVKKIPVVSKEGEGSLKLNDAEKNIEEELSCTFHDDFSLENNPTTYRDAVRIYATLPKMLGEYGEKAVPVKVWLYPLTKLDSNAARLVRNISSQLVFDMEDTLEKLTEVGIRCNDLMKNPIATTFPEIKEKIQKLKDLCKQHKQLFQEQLQEILPSVRSGEEEEDVLVDMLKSFGQSPFNSQMLTAFLKKKEQEMNIVKSYISAVKDLEIVSSQTRLDDILLENTNDLVVSFTFTSLRNEEPYLSDLDQWLQKKYSEGNPDPTTFPTSSSSKEQSKPWFEDEERKQKIRQAAKSISEFAKNNKENCNARFIVSSAHDCENPGACIYLYEHGSLISTSYELPSKLVPLLAGGITHDSVQLMFRPAAYGRSGYQVEYKIAGEENWVKVKPRWNQEKYTVEELHPNTEYTFRCAAAMAESGLSQRCEEIKFHLAEKEGIKGYWRYLKYETELRILLVGGSGSGKSTTGNTILGSKRFRSSVCTLSVTTKSQRENTVISGRNIVVVDTPSFFDTSVPEDKAREEMGKCLELLKAGPHAIIYVMQLGRFSREEKEVAQLIQKILRFRARAYVIILFSKADTLEGKSIEEFVLGGREDIQDCIDLCGGRYLAFNNRADGEGKKNQVAKLLEMIDSLVEKNRAAPCYTQDMLKKDKEEWERLKREICEEMRSGSSWFKP